MEPSDDPTPLLADASFENVISLYALWSSRKNPASTYQDHAGAKKSLLEG
jgi:hypothetical protein